MHEVHEGRGRRDEMFFDRINRMNGFWILDWGFWIILDRIYRMNGFWILDWGFEIVKRENS